LYYIAHAKIGVNALFVSKLELLASWSLDEKYGSILKWCRKLLKNLLYKEPKLDGEAVPMKKFSPPQMTEVPFPTPHTLHPLSRQQEQLYEMLKFRS
jgi:hypothetical protein